MSVVCRIRPSSFLKVRDNAAQNIAFSEINVEEDLKFRNEMIARSNRRTVPQIFLGDKHIGGCEDLFALNDSGELDRLIQGAG